LIAVFYQVSERKLVGWLKSCGDFCVASCVEKLKEKEEIFVLSEFLPVDLVHHSTDPFVDTISRLIGGYSYKNLNF
jgi:hypothetical protein